MPHSAETTPFDQWIKRGLHERYGAVLREALPDELERLVKLLPELPACA